MNENHFSVWKTWAADGEWRHKTLFTQFQISNIFSTGATCPLQIFCGAIVVLFLSFNVVTPNSWIAFEKSNGLQRTHTGCVDTKGTYRKSTPGAAAEGKGKTITPTVPIISLWPSLENLTSRLLLTNSCRHRCIHLHKGIGSWSQASSAK